ncbi:RNA 2'-phosphotransferase [Brevibacillus sp. GCM10020057]|uniref:RNA 2'-phosphotransferase n=1 Tax=Brevibacillus sp. GCM10020057 TaxID=3317327 RepID=UPI0036287B41
MLASHEEARLRKRLLSVLRQNSEYVRLYYDTYGYTPVEPLLAYIRTLKGGEFVTRAHLWQVVEHDPGRLFEWDGGELIRATHGFSPTIAKGRLAEEEPPELLYYGTHRKLVGQALTAGLLPIASEYVQLAASPTAIGEPLDTLSLLVVKAGQAHAAGVRFYRLCTSEVLPCPYYFAEAIAPAFLQEY